MKKILILLFILLLSCGKAEAVTWDLLDEDCSDISDWVDDDNLNGVSEVSPAGQFRFDANTSGVNNYARRNRDVGSYTNTFTLEIELYHDDIGTLSDSDTFRLDCWRTLEYFNANFASDGLFIFDTDSGNTEVGTNLVKEGGSAEWQTWRFLITFGVVGDGTCDVYLNDSTHNWEKVGTGIPCSNEAVKLDGVIDIYQLGTTTNDMVSHIDYIKIATGLYVPYIDIGLRVRKLGSTINIGAKTLDGHKLRIRKGATTYGIPLVATNDPTASPIRIYDGANVKSLPLTE